MYYRARYYNPGVGRFVSEDPIPLYDRNLSEENAYTYVANIPISQKDASGEKILMCCRKTTWDEGNHCYFWDDRKEVIKKQKKCCSPWNDYCTELGPKAKAQMYAWRCLGVAEKKMSS